MPGFCRDKGLIYPVMQQLSSAMQQLKRQPDMLKFSMDVFAGVHKK
jgi:hypothetical protein